MWRKVSIQLLLVTYFDASQVVKNPPTNAGDTGGVSSIPELGRSPGEGTGNPLQYSCLENPIERGTWRAIVHDVPKSQTLQTELHTHISISIPPRLFQCVFPLMPSRNTYHLTWVSLSLDVGHLFTAAPAKHSRCSLPQYASKFGKFSSGHRTGKGQF